MPSALPWRSLCACSMASRWGGLPTLAQPSRSEPEEQHTCAFTHYEHTAGPHFRRHPQLTRGSPPGSLASLLIVFWPDSGFPDITACACCPLYLTAQPILILCFLPLPSTARSSARLA